MDGHTAAIGALPDADVSRRVLRLQILTVAWMSIEVVVALAAALTAKSPALLGFGGGSAARAAGESVDWTASRCGPILARLSVARQGEDTWESKGLTRAVNFLTDLVYVDLAFNDNGHVLGD